jgi:hypothetical protein
MPQPRQGTSGAAAPGERAAARRQPRPVTPQEAAEWRRGLASAGKATAITGATTTAAASATSALVASIAARGVTRVTAAQVKAATALLLRALGRYARRREGQLVALAEEVFVSAAPDASAAEMRALRRMEVEYHHEFLQRQEDRVRAEMRRALTAVPAPPPAPGGDRTAPGAMPGSTPAPSPGRGTGPSGTPAAHGVPEADAERARREAVAKLLTRERRWTAAHEEAVAARAAGWAEAVQVGRASPDGTVVWTLGKRINHTPDCVAMHGRRVPLAALVQERFVPPVHFLCGCRLVTPAEAEAAGVLRPGSHVLSLAAAVRVIRDAKDQDDHGRVVEARVFAGERGS